MHQLCAGAEVPYGAEPGAPLDIRIGIAVEGLAIHIQLRHPDRILARRIARVVYPGTDLIQHRKIDGGGQDRASEVRVILTCNLRGDGEGNQSLAAVNGDSQHLRVGGILAVGAGSAQSALHPPGRSGIIGDPEGDLHGGVGQGLPDVVRDLGAKIGKCFLYLRPRQDRYIVQNFRLIVVRRYETRIIRVSII